MNRSLLSALLVLGFAVPADAADLPTISVERGSVGVIDDPAKGFALEGDAKEVAWAQVVFIRLGWPMFGVSSSDAFNLDCRSVAEGAQASWKRDKRDLSSLPPSRGADVTLGSALLAPIEVSQSTGATVKLNATHRVFVTEKWSRQGDAARWRIPVEASAFFRPGARACGVVLVGKVKKAEERLTKDRPARTPNGSPPKTVQDLFEEHASASPGSPPDPPATLIEEAEAWLTTQGLKPSGESALHDLLDTAFQRNPVERAQAAREAAGRFESALDDILARTQQLFEGTAVLDVSGTDADPLGRLLARGLARQGTLVFDEEKGRVIDVSTEGEVEGLSGIVNDGTLVGVLLHFKTPVTIEKTKRSYRPLPLDARTQRVGAGPISLHDLLSLARGHVQFGDQDRPVALMELDQPGRSPGDLLVAPWDGTPRPAELEQLATKIDRLSDTLGSLLATGCPESPSTDQQLIACWLTPDADPLDTVALRQAVRGLLDPLRALVNPLKELAQAQRWWTEHSSELVLHGSTVVTTVAGAAEQPALGLRRATNAGDFFTPTFGFAAVIAEPDRRPYITGALLLQLHFWPNPATEPMWVNGADDLRRLLYLEVGLRFLGVESQANGLDTSGLGESDRYVGLNAGIPPVFLGGGIHPLPFFTLSAGAAFLGRRNVAGDNVIAELVLRPYVAATLELDLPSLVTEAGRKGKLR